MVTSPRPKSPSSPFSLPTKGWYFSHLACTQRVSVWVMIFFSVGNLEGGERYSFTCEHCQILSISYIIGISALSILTTCVALWRPLLSSLVCPLLWWVEFQPKILNPLLLNVISCLYWLLTSYRFFILPPVVCLDTCLVTCTYVMVM